MPSGRNKMYKKLDERFLFMKNLVDTNKQVTGELK